MSRISKPILAKLPKYTYRFNYTRPLVDT